jgi:uncharacterized membrane protein HdeD (DUF308 family)
MNLKRLLGIILILLGLLFVIYPIYSASAVSFIAGISLIAFGFAAIIDGFSLLSMMAHMTVIEVLVGMCSIMLGILFIYSIDALSFIVGFQFYLIAFVLILIGLIGLFTRQGSLAKLGSVLILIFGIITVFLAAFSIEQPLFVAILVGVSLLVEGIILLVIPSLDEANAIEG